MPTTSQLSAGVPPAQVTDAERFQTDRVAAIAAGHAVHDTYTAFLPPLLPTFIANLSLSITEAGLLSVFMQAPSLFQPVIGYLADRASLRYLVILGPAVTAVMMSLLGIAPNYAVMAVLLTVVGFSSAGFHAVAPAMAGHLSGRKLGRGMGFMMVGGELGRTLGPLIIVGAVSVLSLQGTPWLMLAGLLTSVLLYFRLRDVPMHPPNAGPGLPWRPALRKMGPLLTLVAGVITARSLIISALTTYLPVFLSQEGADLWFAGASLSVVEVAGVVGALAGGLLSDRLGRRLVIALSLLTAPLLMLVFMGIAGWVRFALLLALGFIVLSIPPALMALVQERFPENRALANGLYMALNFLIQSAATVAMGAVGDLFGLRVAFITSAVVPLLGLPFALLLPGKGLRPGSRAV